MIFNRYAKGGAGGFLPNIVVTAPTGSTVTCTKDDKTLNAVEDNGTWTFKVPEFGIWTVNAVQGSATKSATVDVEEVKIYSVTITYVSNTLDENSWATIKSVSDAGTGANYWSVGDCKQITLNGKLSGGLTLNNFSVYVYIIGFNHNSVREGTGIAFFGFKLIQSDKEDICLQDKYYGQIYSSTRQGLCMNTGYTQSGGWNGSYMKSTIIPAFKACLPSDLQGVIKTTTIYTDNVGGSTASSNVTSSSETCYLLSEYELTAETTHANNAEQNYQKQYSYYSAGNRKTKSSQDSDYTTIRWWLRSPGYGDDYDNFCYYLSGSSVDLGAANYSNGFAPAFKV